MKTLIFVLALVCAYCLITFPVLGLHGPACLCDQCLEDFEAERG